MKVTDAVAKQKMVCPFKTLCNGSLCMMWVWEHTPIGSVRDDIDVLYPSFSTAQTEKNSIELTVPKKWYHLGRVYVGSVEDADKLLLCIEHNTVTESNRLGSCSLSNRTGKAEPLQSVMNEGTAKK
jgi:hypothetical protein